MIVLTKLILFKRPLGSVLRHFRHHYSWRVVEANAKQANLTPFTTISLYINKERRVEYSVANLVGNIIGFMPLGLLLPLLFRSLRSVGKMIGISFLVSLLFEVTQLLTALGSFDVDDLLLNTIGGLLGYWIFLLFQRSRTAAT
jgi:glycopeptide antibiotics resistance protein